MHYLINWASIIKQKCYCNIDGFIYAKCDSAIPEVSPKMDIEIVVMRNEDDLKNYSNIDILCKRYEKYRYLLQNGCQVYLALYDKKIASCIWICDINQYHPYLYLDHPIFQGRQNYYIFNVRTSNSFQKKGIFTYTHIKILKDTLKNENVKIFSLIHFDNLISQKAHERLGFKKIGSLKYIQFLQFVLLSDFFAMTDTSIFQNDCEGL